jgi:hypothetical protein
MMHTSRRIRLITELLFNNKISLTQYNNKEEFNIRINRLLKYKFIEICPTTKNVTLIKKTLNFPIKIINMMKYLLKRND